MNNWHVRIDGATVHITGTASANGTLPERRVPIGHHGEQKGCGACKLLRRIGYPTGTIKSAHRRTMKARAMMEQS